MVDILKVGTAQAARGELATGTIRGVELSCGTWIDLPVIVINGVEDGPTLLLTSTEHGDEIQGIEVIRQVTRHHVDPKNLKGAIIAIPVSNPLAFMHQLYKSWIDNEDVSGISAEYKEGDYVSTTAILAKAIWENAYKKADMVINFHCNIRPTALIFQIVDNRNPEIRQTVEKMAEVFGVTAIYEGGDEKLFSDEPPTLANLAQREGIPVLMIELIEGGRISEPSTTAGVRGVLNVMKESKMLPGEIEPQTGFPIIPGRCYYHKMIRCVRGGVIHPFKFPGEFIKKGEVIARTYDVWGEAVEDIEMPVDGYIWAFCFGMQLGTAGHTQIVNSGDEIAFAFVSEE
jgi:predicted deacylase